MPMLPPQTFSRSQKTNGSSSATQRSVDAVSVSEEDIARLAYDKFVARGSLHGQHQEDWLAAEAELKHGAQRR
jgi:hypothetical protein